MLNIRVYKSQGNDDQHDNDSDRTKSEVDVRYEDDSKESDANSLDFEPTTTRKRPYTSNRVLSTNGKQIRNVNIVSFDMGSDVFHDIRVPDNVNNLENFSQDITLVLHNDDSIALLVYDYISPRDCLVESIEVRVMKHEKEGGCWTRLFTLGLRPHLQLETLLGFGRTITRFSS
ncbi:hypothetical protein LguiB_005311 [Lonicera macranthoides]